MKYRASLRTTVLYALLIVAVAATVMLGWPSFRHTFWALAIGVVVTDLYQRRCPLTELPVWLPPVALTLVAGQLTLLGWCELTYLWKGTQGVDFAIFVQAIDSGARIGSLQTSLLALHSTPFLTHHFAPILFLPSGIVRLGLSPEYAGIAAHLGAIIVIAFISVLASNWRVGPALVLALFLHPTLRIALSWEIRDEILALPFLGIAFFALARGYPTYAALSAAASASGKETLFVIAAAFAATIALVGRHAGVSGQSRHYFRAAAFLCAFSIIGFFLYTEILPHRFFQPTFSLHGRIGAIRTLLSPNVLYEKCAWLVTLAAPLAALPGWNRRCLPYLLPILPSLAAVAVTDFHGMWEPYTYYSVLPVVLAGMALTTAGGFCRQASALELRRVALSLLISSQLGGDLGTLATTHALASFPSIRDALREKIPKDAAVIADDSTCAALWDQGHLIRLSVAKGQKVQFDYIVSKATDPIGRTLEAASFICGQTSSLLIRCRRLSSETAHGAETQPRGEISAHREGIYEKNNKAIEPSTQ